MNKTVATLGTGLLVGCMMTASFAAAAKKGTKMASHKMTKMASSHKMAKAPKTAKTTKMASSHKMAKKS